MHYPDRVIVKMARVKKAVDNEADSDDGAGVDSDLRPLNQLPPATDEDSDY